MEDDLVEIARFIDVSEAHMARGLLSANGIEASIADENFTTAYAFAAVGAGVRLSVPLAQKAEALALLHEVRQGKFFDASDAAVAKRPEEDLAIERCPACRGQDIFRPRALIGALLFIAKALPVVFATRRRVCRTCRHEWRASTRRPIIPHAAEVSAALGRRD